MDVYTPSLDQFRELAAGPANLIPVYREFAADLAEVKRGDQESQTPTA